MAAYVKEIQEPERKAGVEVLTHQKWSGAYYYDNLLKLVTGGVSSTSAMGACTFPLPPPCAECLLTSRCRCHRIPIQKLMRPFYP